MSEDRKSSESPKEAEEISPKGGGTSSIGRSLARTISSNGEEESPIATVGSSQEEIPEGASGIGQEEFLTSYPGDGQEELTVGATGGDQEASASGGAIPKPKIVLGIEDVQHAFLSNARNQLNQFQTIKDELLETIRDLKQTARRNPGNWVFFERLRDHINEAYAFLDEIKQAMSMQESREEYMTLQINQFFERRKQEGENFKGTTVKVGTIEGVDVTIKTDCIESDEQDAGASAGASVDKSKIAMAIVDKVMQGAKLTRNVGQAGEAILEPPAVAMEVEKAPDEPPMMDVAADANVAQDIDDDERLPYPVVTGKYTLAIRAHQLFPESSSEDSPPEELDQYPRGAERNPFRRDNDGEMAEDPQEDSSSDSPVEETSHQL